ncbi:class I SAM-dependent methyltransferase [Candidatus Babeliales bacterium]|nr:class I SAM-dependent methyltransferase [Candidatus Babeliales bacterium]
MNKILLACFALLLCCNTQIDAKITAVAEDKILQYLVDKVGNKVCLADTVLGLVEILKQTEQDAQAIASIIELTIVKSVAQSYENALRPIWYIQVPFTAIGLFIWDLRVCLGDNVYAKDIVRLFEKALFIHNLNTYQMYRVQEGFSFATAMTTKDFAKAHRVFFDNSFIKDLHEELGSLIKVIQEESIENLLDAKYLEEHLLLQLGLNNENSYEFPQHLSHAFGKGLKSWQYPSQFSKFLVSLAKLKVDTYLEIGCRHGGTFIIVTEYLKRFNPSIKSVAVDPYYSLNLDIYAHDINSNATYIVDYSMSNRFIDLSKNHWTISFIDGDHSFEGVTSDYQLVKHNSDILVFHDIDSHACPGVVSCWNYIKRITPASRYQEFIDQYQEVYDRMNKKYLGIGVVYQV